MTLAATEGEIPKPGEQTLDQKMLALRGQLRDMAEVIKKQLGVGDDPHEIHTPTHGVKILIVRTADGGCYVYDGVRGVCRVCDGVSEGET